MHFVFFFCDIILVKLNKSKILKYFIIASNHFQVNFKVARK